MMDQEHMDTHPWPRRPAGAPHRFAPPPPQFLTTLLLPLLIGLASGLFAGPAAAQTASCSASDTAVTAVITDGNDTEGRAALAGDCATLLDLMDELRGTGSLNWSRSTDMASWDGITVTGSRVTGLDLRNRNLTGRVPAAWSGLASLEGINLAENDLTGPIPDLSSLTSLRLFSLTNNDVSGTIDTSHLPSSLTNLTLYGNELSGLIPDLSGLSNLTHLDLAYNQLSGRIPSLSALTSLNTLSLQYNKLVGPIPDLSSLTEVTIIRLNDNILSGPIPDLSHLGKLFLLHLERNRLTGGIPNVSNSTPLVWLYLNDNLLSGTINASHFPSSLQRLMVHRNQLTGSIPNLSGLGSLQVLYLHQNQLTGTIPASLGSISSLVHLSLAGNPLTGGIPSQLGSLGSLAVLILCDTDLDATLDSADALPNALETRLGSGLTVYSCLRIDDVAADEGDSLTFTVTHDTYPVRGSSSAISLNVNYKTADATAKSGVDYAKTSGTLTISANTDAMTTSSSTTIPVTTTEDADGEPDETLAVTLSGWPNNATLLPTKTTAYGRIKNDDGETTPAGLSVLPSPVRTLENGAVEYSLWLNSEPQDDVTLAIATTGTNDGAATVVPATYTITAGSGGNWISPAKITVTGVGDAGANENRDVTVRHTPTSSMDANYNGRIHDLQLNVDDAPEVEAFWDWDGSTRRLHRPNTITSTDGATPDPNMYPLHNLSYVLRLSNRPEPGGTVTVTATVPADKANLVGLSLTSPPHREDTPAFANWARNLPATLTVEFKDREPNDGNGCNNSFAFYEDDYFDKNGRLRSRNGLKSESYDGTPDTPWKCWRNVVVVRKPASRNNAHTCADITHTASGGGVRQVAADTIRAHIWNFNNPPSSHRETCAKLSGTPQRAPSQAPPPVVPVQAVANVQVTAIDAVSATVTWDAVAHATGYQVEWEGHGAQASSAGILPGLTGTTATIPHDAPEAMTLTIRVMPAYVDGNGDMQVLDDLAGTATLVVGLAAYRDLIADVRGYAAENYGQAHQARWQRVLAAFGDANGSTPMTAPEAQTMADTYSRNRWDPVVEALTALKVCVSDTLYQSVTGYSTENYGQAHQARWQRVLAAFGDANGSTPMTATEAQTMADTYSRNRWAPVAKTLECLES